MSWQDLVNSGFEAFGAVAILRHCWVLYKAKRFEGISFASVAFFWSWGIWNCYYYYHLVQYFSWYAGMSIMVANCIWLSLMIYYKKYPGGRSNVPWISR